MKSYQARRLSFKKEDDMVCYLLKRMHKVRSGNRTDSINSLLHLAIEHMPEECKGQKTMAPVGLFLFYL